MAGIQPTHRINGSTRQRWRASIHGAPRLTTQENLRTAQASSSVRSTRPIGTRQRDDGVVRCGCHSAVGLCEGTSSSRRELGFVQGSSTNALTCCSMSSCKVSRLLRGSSRAVERSRGAALAAWPRRRRQKNYLRTAAESFRLTAVSEFTWTTDTHLGFKRAKVQRCFSSQPSITASS